MPSKGDNSPFDIDATGTFNFTVCRGLNSLTDEGSNCDAGNAICVKNIKGGYIVSLNTHVCRVGLLLLNINCVVTYYLLLLGNIIYFSYILLSEKVLYSANCWRGKPLAS